ncbi:hypothetical protein SPRG_07447 [Saprolegnia parasitica CBS 223.65]|uniref:Uncharacterized protein n=1 Tax=Saprolegnia parasitica (strain CBS 223.65) TaxID=695850 RepID=A0A067C9R0_SAPPC|nr:hypothetical protein SPRG_07447 [Saprolegnia parasitica CBS 223.65]KDO27198.1 hypothetical protein SPRG_07447 [Saprolegnia parasitica CBS 223.65]|eukprot:XP_012201976.1 hypothetical protein SPRG_07447 [Saprolegnia parasitica CBS 223.65]
MADTTIEYGAALAPIAMDNEEFFTGPLTNYYAAEARDECSDSEDALYYAALATAFGPAPTHAISSRRELFFCSR